MCELSTRLVAWLDSELPDGEAAEVEQHIRACRECQECLDRYKRVSGMVSAYCDATLTAKRHKGGVPGWAPVLGAAASLAVLLAVFAHWRAERASVPPSPVTVASAPEAIAPAARSREAHALVSRRLHKPNALVDARPQDETQGPEWLPAEPAIEIAIPGDEVFPPGALPAGVDFVADVSIAVDGSAQRLRLRPQLTGFEGGPNQ